METFNTHYFRGNGPVFIARRDAAGNPLGFNFIGDLESAQLAPNISRQETIENVTGSRAVGVSLLDSVRYNLTLNMRSIKRDHLAIALQGTPVDLAAGSITDEAHTAYTGSFIKLARVNVSAVVVTNAAGSVTYTAGDDYVVHGPSGLVEILATGTISDASGLLIDYSYVAQGRVPASPANNEYSILFSGINTANQNKQARCEIYRCKLDPGSFSLITSETTSSPISGVIELDRSRAAGDQLFSWTTED